MSERAALEGPHAEVLRAAEDVIARVGYEHATVTDIAREAGVSRQTFYRHYDSLEEVMRRLAALMAQEVCDTARSQDSEQDGARRLSVIFTVMGRHRPFLSVLDAEGHLSGFMLAFWRFFDAHLSSSEAMEDGQRLTMARFAAGGFLALTHEWISSGDEMSPEEALAEVRAAVLQLVELLFE